MNVKFWDLVFYLTFGIVVTSSVQIAGVLLVFSFLIVPSICGALLGKSIGSRLMVGWIVGALTSIAGVVASYYLDLPTGAAVVVAFGACLLLCAGLRGVIIRPT